LMGQCSSQNWSEVRPYRKVVGQVGFLAVGQFPIIPDFSGLREFTF
jgi:hypothetical protein